MTKSKLVQKRNEAESKVQQEETQKAFAISCLKDAKKISKEIAKSIKKANTSTSNTLATVVDFAPTFMAWDLEPRLEGKTLSQTEISASGKSNGKPNKRTDVAVFNHFPKGEFWNSEVTMRKIRALGVVIEASNVIGVAYPTDRDGCFALVSNLPKEDDKKASLWEASQGNNEMLNQRLRLVQDYINSWNYLEGKAIQMAIGASNLGMDAKTYDEYKAEEAEAKKAEAKTAIVEEAKADAEAEAEANPDVAIVTGASNYLAIFKKYSGKASDEARAEALAIISQLLD